MNPKSIGPTVASPSSAHPGRGENIEVDEILLASVSSDTHRADQQMPGRGRGNGHRPAGLLAENHHSADGARQIGDGPRPPRRRMDQRNPAIASRIRAAKLTIKTSDDGAGAYGCYSGSGAGPNGARMLSSARCGVVTMSWNARCGVVTMS